jgi:NAD(P)-dependent dehydrogenase (short-subunit alcohol dehydrogenase family)
MKLQGKTAIVTGAGSGIGRATALLFAEEGACVTVADVNAATAAATAAEIRQAGGEALAFTVDVRRSDQVIALVAATTAAFSRIDVLANVAGIAGVYKPVHELSEEEWDWILDINLKGHFLCSRYAVPVMLQSGGGTIIHTSSTLAYQTLPNTAAYTASKAAIVGLTRAMALDLARRNIRVNCVVPGSVDTPLMWEGLNEEERRAIEPQAAEAEPLGRIAHPMEIARAVLFLACADSSFITGSALAVDGGLLARLAAPH